MKFKTDTDKALVYRALRAQARQFENSAASAEAWMPSIGTSVAAEYRNLAHRLDQLAIDIADADVEDQ